MRDVQTNQIGSFSTFSKILNVAGRIVDSGWNSLSSAWTATRHAQVVAQLNAHLQHDIGETDLCETDSRLHHSDRSSVEAMLQRLI
jgi:hypothetical protein